MIAAEQGFASWAEAKAAFAPVPAVNAEKFFRGAGGAFLFPYRGQFALCEADFVAALGMDPDDPD